MPIQFSRQFSWQYITVLLMCALYVYQAHATATDQTSNPNASNSTRAVQAYLTALSNNTIPGVIAGQNAGHSNDFLNKDGLMGFAPLVLGLQQATGEAPGIIGVDYEHDKIATPAQLSAVNKTLIEYWNSGGLISINWAPHNPWWNDEKNIIDNPGIWNHTRTNGGDMSKVDLTQLLNPQSPMHKIWRRKLDRIASALTELQQADVVILWRPLQEMNGNWFWWGISSAPNDPQPYINLWIDMHRYFTEEKKLNNLLWVYSPNQGPKLTERSLIKPIDWRYPGAQYVDVIAGTAYNNSLEIRDYKNYQQFKKPIAMAEFGPAAGDKPSRTGTFDTRLYAKQLQKKYPDIAYWMSWSSWDNGDGTQENQALVHNQNVKALLSNPAIISRHRVAWKNYLFTNKK
ncbi:MAG: hypothetical protein B0W54_08390 [Cellvibrio sp. 79]|nr:MAG: hypothetical protein B0W54_08390 [Cellvibrio sp. 79]